MTKGHTVSEITVQLIERLSRLHPRLIDLKLDRMQRLLADLGNPHQKLPPIIHVAGTNGKGSTIAFMRAMLEAEGHLVHVYTSPHLVNFNERMRIGQSGGGQFVSDERLADVLLRCEKTNQGQPITLFEMITTAAFLLFAEQPADVVLLEVGLGGRFDATNVITKPLTSVITPISIDHTDFLGSSIAEIAQEKAGIIKPLTPVVIAKQNSPDAERVTERSALRLGAPLFRYGQEFHLHEEAGRLIYQDETGLLDLPVPRIAGEHQKINAGTAVAALRIAGFGQTNTRLFEQGILSATWPARLQNLSKGNLAQRLLDTSELWLDGGHNRDGARVLAQTLEALNQHHKRPLVLIAGLLNTKDSQGFLDEFRTLAPHVIAVPIPDHAASRSAAEVAAHARISGLTADEADDVEQALQIIAGKQFTPAPRVVICGSLYLAGDVLKRNGTPPL
jgi:dihydrofolate synthase / folylpolyglutamate synthase